MSYPKLSVVLASQLMVSSSSVKGSIPMAMVVVTPRGKTTPEVFYKDSTMVAEFGSPDLKYGKSGLYADTLLKNATDNLTVVRAVSGTSKYAGVLLRAKKGDENLTDLSKDIIVEPTVNPIGGLTQLELDSYNFPLYPRTRAYTKINQMYFGVTHDKLSEKIYVQKPEMFEVGMQFALSGLNETVVQDVTVEGGGVQTGDGEDIQIESNISVEPSGNAQLYTIKSVDSVAQELYISKVQSLINTKPGVTAKGMIYIVDALGNKVRLSNIVELNDLLAIGATQELLMTTSDFLYNKGTYNIVDDSNTVLATVTINSKVSYTETVYAVEFENRPDGNFYAQTFYEVVAGDFEYRDCCLVVSKGQGLDNKNVSIGLEENNASTAAFYLVVYYYGVEKERHSVAMNPEIDGNGIQLDIETVVNLNSRYIQVIKNYAMIDEDDLVMKPYVANSVKWQKADEPYYLDSLCETAEDILKGDNELKVTDISKIGVGTRFIFNHADGTRSAEYKVLVSDAVKSTVWLDRPLDGSKDTIIVGTELYVFDASYNDVAKSIYKGNTKYPVTIIQNASYPLSKGTYIEIGGMLGYLWDGGANRLGGGSDGDAVQVQEIINALYTIEDKDKYPYFFLADGGVTEASYKRAMIQMCSGRNSIAFTSGRLASDKASDPVGQTKQDFIDIGVTSEYFTFSQDWFYMSNPYTLQERIPMPPSLSDLLVQAGAISKDGIWTAAAGWRKGQYFCDGLVREKSQAERVALYNVGINTSKVKAFKGTAKWSDLTGLNQARPLQYLSIMKLAIYIIHNLEIYLEDKHFEDYDENEISEITDSINAFLVNIITSGGMYDAQVVIGDLVNDRKISERVLPIYVAITGKQFIQGINLGLEVQQGTKTSVNLTTANQLVS